MVKLDQNSVFVAWHGTCVKEELDFDDASRAGTLRKSYLGGAVEFGASPLAKAPAPVKPAVNRAFNS